jgi:uncharacterized protein (DUF433 family)
MSYDERMTAALSGATLRQLRYWRTHRENGEPILVPEASPARPIRYSFRDVVALRTCVFLREAYPLQKIRKAIANLRGLGEEEHLSRYRLVGEGKSIVVVTDEEAVDLVERPGQRVVAVMFDILQPFRSRTGTEVPALFHPRSRITVDPDVRGGYPVVSGTRVPYDLVAGLVEDGVPAEEISCFYPSVDAAAAHDAADFAKYVREFGRRREAA